MCDASQHAVLHLSADGKLLEPASRECDGKPLRGPNDLTLDTAGGGFYFSDPGESSDVNPIGTVHYVDRQGKTHLVDSGLAFPNGIVLTPDGKRLLLAESKKNRVLVYDVLAPGKVGPRKCWPICPRKTPPPARSTTSPTACAWTQPAILYVAHYGMRQVQVLSPAGKLAGALSGRQRDDQQRGLRRPAAGSVVCHRRSRARGGQRRGVSPGPGRART